MRENVICTYPDIGIRGNNQKIVSGIKNTCILFERCALPWNTLENCNLKINGYHRKTQVGMVHHVCDVPSAFALHQF